MGRISAVILGAIIGAFAATAAVVVWFGWGLPGKGQLPHVDPTRADYVDLLLTVATILLGATGLAVTVGALAIGLVAFKTLGEIKTEAANKAKEAAADKIKQTIGAELEPNVKTKVEEALPTALQAALLNEEVGHRIFREMAKRGELDEVLERVAMRMQTGGPEGPEPEPDLPNKSADFEDERI